MSIRMKEWGMMSQPSRGVHLPTDGLTGWGAAAQRAGEGISAMLTGTADVLQERARVTTAGELAEFSERLRAIDQETREELADRDVQDWRYAWQQATGPKLEEALGELSAEARGAGRRLAREYSDRASLEAQRDYELRKIDKARTQWRTRVDEAVQAGDAQQAHDWLQAGQGLFIAPGDMEAEQQTARSRASLHHWQRELEQQPLQALCRLSAAEQSELPARPQEAERLSRARSSAGRAARREVLEQLVTCMQDEVDPQPEYIQLATRAGVLTEAQSAAAVQPPVALSHAARRDWLRRIDECSGDAQETEALQLEIATAAIPRAERRSLLSRLAQSVRLPAGQRRSLSRGLRELYQEGALGCPGDDEAQQSFGSLQQESLARLEKEGAAAATRWVSQLREQADRWVCFNPQSQLTQI